MIEIKWKTWIKEKEILPRLRSKIIRCDLNYKKKKKNEFIINCSFFIPFLIIIAILFMIAHYIIDIRESTKGKLYVEIKFNFISKGE